MSRQPGSGNFYFHPNLNESLETTMAGLVDAADPEAIKGRYIAEHGTETLCSAVVNNEMPTDRAFEISKLPSVDQQAAIKAFQASDVGRFKAAYESSIERKTLSRMTSGAPPKNTGAERGEVTLNASIEIPLSLQDIVEIERLRTDVGIETDADYIVEALRMMRIAITLGRVGFVVQARSLTSQAVMDFAVPLDRHDGVRPIKPYGDMSDG